MTRIAARKIVLLACTGLLLAQSAFAQAASVGEPGQASGKPNPLKNLYFGEQHLHS